MSGLPWLVAMASFVAMWTVMMAAMMLPSLAPTLWQYHRAVESMGVPRPLRQTVLVGLGYFVVLAAVGVAVFALGIALSAAEMRLPGFARAVPLTVGVVVLVAGAIQLTEWKAHHLARCREASTPTRSLSPDAAAAWRHGLRFGAHCSLSCAGLMAAVVAVDVMNLGAMAVATAAITAERLASAGARVARATGAVAVGLGVFLLVRAT